MMTFYKNVPRGTFLQLEEFKSLLLKWNKKINLISRSDESVIDERHIADSMQLLNYLPENKSVSILDLGSGAGFPGLILAIFGYQHITLVEADLKKYIFLKEVCSMLGLSCVIENQRIEAMPEDKKYDVITARALASISKLLEYSQNFIHNKSKLLLLKGRNLERELKEAEKDWNFSYFSHSNELLHGSGFIVEITNISRRDDK